MDLLLLFQCPHGLELLRLHKTRISFLKEFQCPHGLELLLIMDGMPVQRIRFNALSGLSCYVAGGRRYLHINAFQCPLGLELLRQECPIF
ncbi:hypothetical protein HMPREF2738_03720 [Clostridiales bacterium KLE1615]|nr:hypothetical protein HMPREF2738_03720 [Clostridiales bacterium KLE1615]